MGATDTNGLSALQHGMNGNASTMRTLARLYKPDRQLAGAMPSAESPDPVGCVREGAGFGCTIHAREFGDAIQRNFPAPFCWSMLRLGGPTDSGALAALEQCQDVVRGWAGNAHPPLLIGWQLS
jgi:hypothetical protein